MQGVRKQIALLLRAGVFAKVPASLYQLSKTHLTLQKNLSFSHDQLAFINALFVAIVFNLHLILRGFKVDPSMTIPPPTLSLT
jgi:hypothetical protein